METLIEKIILLITPEKAVYYFLGFLTFFGSILDNVFTKSKRKPFLWFIQELIYTIITISVGIGIATNFDLSDGYNKLIVIIMGIIGPTIIRKMKNEKDTLADSVLSKLKNKFAKTKTKTTKK